MIKRMKYRLGTCARAHAHMQHAARHLKGHFRPNMDLHQFAEPWLLISELLSVFSCVLVHKILVEMLSIPYWVWHMKSLSETHQRLLCSAYKRCISTCATKNHLSLSCRLIAVEMPHCIFLRHTINHSKKMTGISYYRLLRDKW